MSKIIRGAVSKKKRRYQKNGFDLDLTYVTPRIIAMGFPSENMEGMFRNPMKEVLRFLDSYHKDHFKVYNLCAERGYDPQKFYNRVEVFPFDDHNAPPFELILNFCQSVQKWLDENERNIAVIHCKAGKGRTGLMICAFMLYSKEWNTATEALNFYAAMRTYNKKGVTIPSQIRYVYYFEESVKLENNVQPKALLLTRVVLHTIPKVAHAADINFNIYIYKTLVFSFKEYVEKTQKLLKEEKREKKDKKDDNNDSTEDSHRKSWRKGKDEDEDDTMIFECGGLPLCGDIKVDCSEKSGLGSERIFAFWFNTSFVRNCNLILVKDELDKAHKDKHHKNFAENFRVEMGFAELDDENFQPPAEQQEISSGSPKTGSPRIATGSSPRTASPRTASPRTASPSPKPGTKHDHHAGSTAAPPIFVELDSAE